VNGIRVSRRSALAASVEAVLVLGMEVEAGPRGLRPPVIAGSAARGGGPDLNNTEFTSKFIGILGGSEWLAPRERPA